MLKQSIIKSIEEKSGKGGTYFGATGCGKTFTMAFLARQLALRCSGIPGIGSPTIVVIVDRDELQKQGAKLFTRSKEFLNLGEVSKVKSRKMLREELGARESGGFYICTIQKFCDREDDKIGLINERSNIICFSDEAHRTQLERSKQIKFSKDADENMKAMVSKPYAKVLREAFPHATFVGFTGTPIAETYQTFGDEIDRYTMDQSVADGITVPIKYHPRIAKVLSDSAKVKAIEEYYRKCAEDGATEEDIEASKRAMSSMDIILGDPERLEKLAVDIHDHYVFSCANDPDRIQKAMIALSFHKFDLQFHESFSCLDVFLKIYVGGFIMKQMIRTFCVLMITVLVVISCVPVADAASTVAVTSVKMGGATYTMTINTSIKLTASVTPSNATNKKITWSSSNTKVAQVDQNGVVKGIKEGTATIYAKSNNGKQASCKVIVQSVAVSKLTFAQSSVPIVGKTQLNVTITPANATNRTLTWSSSNTKIVTVDNKGLVTPKDYGTATITVKSSNGKTATCKVTVSKDIMFTKRYTVAESGGYKAEDIIELHVDSKTGKIIATDCYQSKKDFTLFIGAKIYKDGITIYNKTNDYVDVRANWSVSFTIGIGSMNIYEGDVISKTNKYRLYKDGRFKILDSTCSDWLGLCKKKK